MEGINCSRFGSGVMAAITLVFAQGIARAAVVSPNPMQWHKVTLKFEGPQTGETADPNPFRDYRLDVSFTGPTGQVYRVPGYYAADGAAGESGTSAGNVWMASFPPDAPGAWSYSASFVSGTNIALELTGGESAGFFDGDSGTVEVAPTDVPSTGRDFRGHGKLVYDGRHYLHFMGSGRHFVKAGANSPEVFLEYDEFDNTSSGRLYSDHIGDWKAGDPTWMGGKGKGIIGAVNYVSGTGLNAIYFLSMNHGGDGDDAWPWISTGDPDRFDCSKLDQWDIVFRHMGHMGVMAHFVTTETENEDFFENKESGSGEFAGLRKLYYRELISRFGHNLGVTWNIGEENGWNGNNDSQRKLFADYLRALTYYDDMITVHNGPSEDDHIFEPLLGHASLTGPSLQWYFGNDIHGPVLKWRKNSADAGHPWVVSIDEPFVRDKVPDVDVWRRDVVWASYMAGGAGAELYLGGGEDVSGEDYRPNEANYTAAGRAAAFFTEHVPVDQLEPDDAFAPGAWTLKKDGDYYLLYLREGGTTQVNLPAGSYSVAWFNPRMDGELQQGSVASLPGGAAAGVGNPPASPDSDWAVVIQNVNFTALDPRAHASGGDSHGPVRPGFSQGRIGGVLLRWLGRRANGALR